MSKLKIYRASAGSGKTHTLTGEFLKLCFEYPDKFKEILAVTFTNKAAEEMKHRIVDELKLLATNPNQSAHLEWFIDKQASPNIDLIQRQAQKIITTILHNYSAFNVSTMDSFVQRVIRAFAYEIGVHGGYRIEMDENRVINDLTDILYQQLDSDKELLRWLIRYAEYKVDEGSNWDFRKEIRALVKEIFKEKFRQFSTSTQTEGSAEANKEKSRKLLNELYGDILRIKNNFEQKMESFGRSALKTIELNDISPTENGQNFKYICNYLCNKIINAKSLSEYTPNKTVRKCLDGIENWYAKKASTEIIANIERVFYPVCDCLAAAIDLHDKEFTNYMTAYNLLSNFHAFGILNDVTSLLPDYRDDNNLLLISDTTHLLREIVAHNDAPFIFEKVGNKFKHLLIDEFQDTSSFQWDNFKPLVTNSLAEGNQNLIVGDVKQSIYRWRNGDWRLLLSQVEKELGSHNVQNETLDVNWRSRKNIIDFNNSVFSSIPVLLQQIYKNDGLLETEFDEMIEKAYFDSFQLLPSNKSKEGGRVKIEFVQVETRSEMRKKWREKAYEKIIQNIDDLLLNRGYSAGDIAILVRSNKDGKDIVDLLLDYQLRNPMAPRYQLISADSLFLSSSPVIQIMINAMKFIADQRDEIALATLLMLCNNPSNKFFEELDLRLSNLPESFEQTLNELGKLPLFELSCKLIDIFELNKQTTEIPYLQRFHDCMIDYTRDNNSDLFSFINWWDDNNHSVSLQLSDKQNAINVMTVHKSKGLAFKVVLIPFCDWQIDNTVFSTAPILWCKTTQSPYNKFSYLPMKYKKDLGESYFSRDYYEEKLYLYMDALNMLYVAVTRPKEELIIIAPSDFSTKTSSIADLIYLAISKEQKYNLFANPDQAFIQLPQFFNVETSVFEIETIKNVQSQFKEESGENIIEFKDYPIKDWRDKLTIKHDANEYFIKSNLIREKKINYGTLMHKVLSRINSENDLEKVINEMMYSGVLNNYDSSEVKENILKILRTDEVSEWFSGKWTVKSELPILTISGDKKIPDKILFAADETIVIDFKFGDFHSEYKTQITEYVELLRKMDYPNVSGVLYFPDKNKKYLYN